MSTNPLKTPPDERLRFLVETVLAESALLQGTDDRPAAFERALKDRPIVQPTQGWSQASEL